MMENKTGIQPMQGRVLVMPELVDEKDGLIHKAIETIERQKMAQTKALIIEIGEDAFVYEDGSRWKNEPKVGDKILIAKWAGALIWITHDKRNLVEYRIVNDADIVAIITEDTDIKAHL